MKDDFFSLFGLPARFDVDQTSLDEAYRTVQSQAHPDRFANAGDAERRVAMQWAAHANEAYRTLRQPLKRAIYLLTLRGVDIQAENNTAMAPAFLMQQMEWREELDEARDAAAFDKLRAEVDAGRARALSSLDWLIDEKGDYAGAARQVRALMFIERFADDVERRLEALGQ